MLLAWLDESCRPYTGEEAGSRSGPKQERAPLSLGAPSPPGLLPLEEATRSGVLSSSYYSRWGSMDLRPYSRDRGGARRHLRLSYAVYRLKWSLETVARDLENRFTS